MPIGLDGNPEPLSSPQRDALLDSVANLVLVSDAVRPVVGVDGRAGSGKSTFADELARALRGSGREVYRSTTDSFHNPRAVRWHPGLGTAESYFRCSHDLSALQNRLLDPFVAGEPCALAVFDEPSDSSIVVEPVQADLGAVLVFDGLFLHRAELEPHWVVSVFLEADRRLDARVGEWARGADAERVAAYRSRYIDGWALYVDECRPREQADVVIDNEVFEAPRVVGGDRAGRVTD